ncbi:hypothetical protein ACFSRY_12095 [Pontibacter locisalis]|uniref:Uncharacterized protein n=1 Tax=Pontibacter locisalis TaxID=1719035 RepID=A0ABW5IPA2_9BACT
MKTLKLIEGIFTPSEAAEILLEMINKKINFHNLKNLSSQIHFSRPDSVSGRRIKELKEAREQLLCLIEEAKINEENLVIESQIKISFETEGLPKEICLEVESY